jgi:hypothetical protein
MAALLGLLILGLLGCGGGGGEENKADKDKADKEQPKVDTPKKVAPPPADLVESWGNYNARVGRLRFDPRKNELVFETKTIERPTDLLAFQFDEPTEEGLRKVMAPEVPFGLVIDEAHDAVLAGISRFKNLQNLQLLRCWKEVTEDDKKKIQEVTAKGVTAVGDIAGLQSLTISDSKIGDDAVVPLASLKKLKTLLLNNNPNLGDGACKNLASSRSIEELALGSTHVTSAGLKSLGSLTQLRSLDLSNDDIPSLADLPNQGRLQVLILKGCKGVNDSALAQVVNCKQLQRLDLGHTSVTDAGIKNLVGLKQLKALGTSGVDVDQETIKALRREAPEVRLVD